MKIHLTALAWAIVASTMVAQNARQETVGQNAQAQFAIALIRIAAPNGQMAVKLNRASLHAGVYKKNFEVQQPTQAGDILCRILNRDLQTLDSILIKNPLQVRTEFPDENGVIGATMLHYTEQELLLRFNYRAEMQHLLFSRFESDTETTEIATIPLIFE
jgi:hypothetical protein